jgi:hypothetical protein
MLMLLANDANEQGVVFGISMADLADRMEKSERGVAGVKGRLKTTGILVELLPGGGRGRQAVYWIKLPGLVGPEEGQVQTPQNVVKPRSGKRGKEAETPQSSAGNEGERSIGGKTTTGREEEQRELPKPPKTAEAKRHQFFDLLGTELEDDAEMVADAVELLRRNEKVASKLVTPDEMAKAAAAVGTFNRCFCWKGREGSDFGLGANLTSVVQRIRHRPSWSLEKWVRLVESAWRIRWWEQNGRDQSRRPTPQVIFSPKSFENVVQDARDEAAGEKPADIKKRRYTRGDDA